MKPLPTWNSPISDKELWQCAHQQIGQHGDQALVVAAERMADMERAADRAGYATWAGIALRIAKLGKGAIGVAVDNDGAPIVH